jgi:hypothetical protein
VVDGGDGLEGEPGAVTRDAAVDGSTGGLYYLGTRCFLATGSSQPRRKNAFLWYSISFEDGLRHSSVASILTNKLGQFYYKSSSKQIGIMFRLPGAFEKYVPFSNPSVNQSAAHLAWSYPSDDIDLDAHDRD